MLAAVDRQTSLDCLSFMLDSSRGLWLVPGSVRPWLVAYKFLLTDGNYWMYFCWQLTKDIGLHFVQILSIFFLITVFFLLEDFHPYYLSIPIRGRKKYLQDQFPNSDDFTISIITSHCAAWWLPLDNEVICCGALSQWDVSWRPIRAMDPLVYCYGNRLMSLSESLETSRVPHLSQWFIIAKL